MQAQTRNLQRHGRGTKALDAELMTLLQPTVIRLSSFGATSIATSLYSSKRPALCIWKAMGPVLPADGPLEVHKLYGFASWWLGNRQPGGAFFRIDHKFDLAPGMAVEWTLRDGVKELAS